MARKTKAQREAEQRAGLRRRVLNLALGVNAGCGLSIGETDGDFYQVMGAEDFFTFLRAIQNVFPQDAESTCTYDIWNLHHFSDIEQAVEWLWERGIRP